MLNLTAYALNYAKYAAFMRHKYAICCFLQTMQSHVCIQPASIKCADAAKFLHIQFWKCHLKADYMRKNMKCRFLQNVRLHMWSHVHIYEDHPKSFRL